MDNKTKLEQSLPIKKYVSPQTELTSICWERMCANPTSWADGQGGVFKIKEGDPGGDGKGAKMNSLWLDDDDDMAPTAMFNMKNINLWNDDEEEDNN